jgi:hypothetical protein
MATTHPSSVARSGTLLQLVGLEYEPELASNELGLEAVGMSEQTRIFGQQNI